MHSLPTSCSSVMIITLLAGPDESNDGRAGLTNSHRAFMVICVSTMKIKVSMAALDSGQLASQMDEQSVNKCKVKG